MVRLFWCAESYALGCAESEISNFRLQIRNRRRIPHQTLHAALCIPLTNRYDFGLNCGPANRLCSQLRRPSV